MARHVLVHLPTKKVVAVTHEVDDPAQLTTPDHHRWFESAELAEGADFDLPDDTDAS